jgi:hypothetical protein
VIVAAKGYTPKKHAVSACCRTDKNLLEGLRVFIDMTHRERAEEYERLRADYNAAFARLRAEESRLQSVGEQSPMDAAAEAAMGAYRECRERLARFLISLRPSGESEASVDFQTVSGWMTARKTEDREAEVQALAYRLWEEAGRPIGSPQEHWYRAEKLLRSGSRRALGKS